MMNLNDNIDSSCGLVYTEYLIPIKVGKYSNEELKILEKIVKMSYEELSKIAQKYWTDIIEMGKKYNIEPWRLVRSTYKNGAILPLHNHPDFYLMHINGHTFKFAQTVIEGEPVFKDDVLYTSSGEKVVFNSLTCNEKFATVFHISNYYDIRTMRIRDLSWNDKSRNIKLNIDDITYLRDFLKSNINSIEGVNYPRMLQIINILSAVK